MNYFTRTPSLVILIAIALILTFVRFSNPPQNILSYDTFGNYLYLPAKYIYHDPGLQNFEWVDSINHVYHNTPTFYQFSEGKDGQKVIRFHRGISYLMMPAFWAGHLWAKMTGQAANGFSKPYTRSIWIWGLILNLIALWYSRKILLQFFDEKITSITLVLIFLVSNLYFFMGYGNEIPHVYLFTLNVLLLYFTIQWHTIPRVGYAIAIGLLIGIIAVSRPSEIFVAFIPLLWGIFNSATLLDKFKLLLRHWSHVVLFVAFAILPVIPQLVYWKTVTGEWIFKAYNDPGSQLDLTNPRFFYTLFGFRKGWFIYSPIMLAAVWGIYRSVKLRKEWGWGTAIYLIINIYLISSFTSLVSYGWRAFIQSYAFLVLPMAICVHEIQKLRLHHKVIASIVAFALLIINIFQAYQVHMGIIDGSRMTRPYYFAVFMKVKPDPRAKDLLLPERPASGRESLTNTEKFFNRVVRFYDYETPDPKYRQYLDSTLSFSGKYSLRLDSTLEFPKGLECKYEDLTQRSYLWIRISVRVYPLQNDFDQKPLLLVTHVVRNGQTFKYLARPVSDTTIKMTPLKWNYFWHDYITPEGIKPDDVIKSYLWFRGKKGYYIDDLRIEIFEPMKDIQSFYPAF